MSPLKKLCIIAAAFLAGAFASQAQNLTANGTVTDEAGMPVIGAGVVQKGTTNGVTTDIDGNFSISVPQGTILEFSSVSYVTRTSSRHRDEGRAGGRPRGP